MRECTRTRTQSKDFGAVGSGAHAPRVTALSRKVRDALSRGLRERPGAWWWAPHAGVKRARAFAGAREPEAACRSHRFPASILQRQVFDAQRQRLVAGSIYARPPPGPNFLSARPSRLWLQQARPAKDVPGVRKFRTLLCCCRGSTSDYLCTRMPGTTQAATECPARRLQERPLGR